MLVKAEPVGPERRSSSPGGLSVEVETPSGDISALRGGVSAFRQRVGFTLPRCRVEVDRRASRSDSGCRGRTVAPPHRCGAADRRNGAPEMTGGCDANRVGEVVSFVAVVGPDDALKRQISVLDTGDLSTGTTSRSEPAGRVVQVERESDPSGVGAGRAAIDGDPRPGRRGAVRPIGVRVQGCPRRGSLAKPTWSWAWSLAVPRSAGVTLSWQGCLVVGPAGSGDGTTSTCVGVRTAASRPGLPGCRVPP